MPKLPRLKAREAERVLFKLGFELVRQTGAHRVYERPDGKKATVPFHGAKTLHPKVVSNIIKDTGLTVEEFIKILKG